MKYLIVLFLAILIVSSTCNQEGTQEGKNNFCFTPFELKSVELIKLHESVHEYFPDSNIIVIHDSFRMQSIKSMVINSQSLKMKFFPKVNVRFVDNNNDTCVIGYHPPNSIKYMGQTWEISGNLFE